MRNRIVQTQREHGQINAGADTITGIYIGPENIERVFRDGPDIIKDRRTDFGPKRHGVFSGSVPAAQTADGLVIISRVARADIAIFKPANGSRTAEKQTVENRHMVRAAITVDRAHFAFEVEHVIIQHRPELG